MGEYKPEDHDKAVAKELELIKKLKRQKEKKIQNMCSYRRSLGNRRRTKMIMHTL
jgi:restriction endonuclease S subunit